jgi:hypothetical protein
VLGASLLARKKYAAAEPLLVSGYDRLRQGAGPDHERTIEARARLFALYGDWKKPEKAALYGPPAAAAPR